MPPRFMKEPISISPGDRVSHARRIMLDNDIGRLPVVENGDIVGIITERDVAKAMMNFRDLVPDNQQDVRIRNLIVGDIMTHNVKSVRTNTPITEVISILLKENIGGVPVLNLRDEMVGVISRREIIKYAGGERMRRDVSELTNKLDIGKISSLLDIPEHSITGALRRKTLQYVMGNRNYSGSISQFPLSKEALAYFLNHSGSCGVFLRYRAP